MRKKWKKKKKWKKFQTFFSSHCWNSVRLQNKKKTKILPRLIGPPCIIFAIPHDAYLYYSYCYEQVEEKRCTITNSITPTHTCCLSPIYLQKLMNFTLSICFRAFVCCQHISSGWICFVIIIFLASRLPHLLLYAQTAFAIFRSSLAPFYVNARRARIYANTYEPCNVQRLLCVGTLWYAIPFTMNASIFVLVNAFEAKYKFYITHNLFVFFLRLLLRFCIFIFNFLSSSVSSHI